MSRSETQSEHEDVLHLTMDWRWHRPKRRRDLPKGEPRHEERPVKCTTRQGTIGVPAESLPYPTASLAEIDGNSILAYVRNDDGLANEITRILAPGGILHLDVPATGLLAGLDAYNLHRYLVDITKRGLRPFETAEVGWRRHFSIDDIRELFDPGDWDYLEAKRTGIAAGEMIRLSGFVGFRWLRASRNRYRQFSRIADRVQQHEQTISVPNGFWIHLTLRRR